MENEEIKAENKMMTDKMLKIFIFAGILMVSAVVSDYFFVVQPEQKVKELSQIKLYYNNYRNVLSHNTAMTTNVGLDIGLTSSPVLQSQNGLYLLNLVPFYNVSVMAVNTLLKNPETLENNQTIANIYKK